MQLGLWQPQPGTLPWAASSSSSPAHPLLFTASSIIIYQLTDPSPSELGKVETNNKTQPVLQRLYNLGKKKKKKLSLQAKMP